MIEKGNRLARWLWSHGHFDVDYIPFGYQGTEEVSRHYALLLDYVERVCAREDCVCDAELIPCLRGLEGQWVLLAFEEGRRARLPDRPAALRRVGRACRQATRMGPR